MFDPYLSILPYHWEEGQIPGCYLTDTSAISVGEVGADPTSFPGAHVCLELCTVQYYVYRSPRWRQIDLILLTDLLC